MTRDRLHRFIFDALAVRGELVQLHETWHAVLERHPYPPAVRGPLGELLAAAALLAATIKFEGSLTLQITGDGPIHLMVVDCRPEPGENGAVTYRLRGVARWRGEVPDGELAGRFGSARLVITIDPGRGGKRYQSIVELTGSHMQEAIIDYLERSEQLPTKLWLAVSEEGAAGMLLQRLPQAEGDSDDWTRLNMLGDTLTGEELLGLEVETLLHRLFHEDDVRLLEAQPVQFHCHCSRERVAATLRGMGREEVESIIAEQGSVEVTCHFCGQRYVLDKLDVEQVFAEETPQPDVGSTRH